MKNIGSIIGDICGSIYEFHYSQDIVLFKEGTTFTDDTVMSCAIADWLINDKEHSRDNLVGYLKKYGRKYANAGYGGKFRVWLQSDNTEDYGSFGNGSGMRVGPVGFYATTLDECLELAKTTALTTHGHPEGIKGAQAIASSIFLARKGVLKQGIKDYITDTFGYNLDTPIDKIGRKAHKFDATCQVTVPEAIICFLNSNSFEDCIRKSIEIGGDTDTIACMAGGIAEAYYGVPAYLEEKAKSLLPDDLSKTLSDLTYYVDKQGIFKKTIIERKPKGE